MELIDFKSPVIVGCYLEDVFSHLSHLPDHEGVYLLTDTVSGLRYVGSSVNVRRRTANYFHPTGLSYKQYNFRDINPRNLSIEMIEDCKGMDLKDLRGRELHWITQLNTFYPNGLNINTPQKGGSSASVRGYLSEKRNGKDFPPCYQLLRFSERMDYFIELLHNTPMNPKWVYTMTARGIPKRWRNFRSSGFSYAERPFERGGSTFYTHKPTEKDKRYEELKTVAGILKYLLKGDFSAKDAEIKIEEVIKRRMVTPLAEIQPGY
jgi:hypothetical protein